MTIQVRPAAHSSSSRRVRVRAHQDERSAKGVPKSDVECELGDVEVGNGRRAVHLRLVIEVCRLVEEQEDISASPSKATSSAPALSNIIFIKERKDEYAYR